MTSFDFLRAKINELVVAFPSIKCLYEFDNSENTHLIEVLPSAFYNTNTDFAKFEATVYTDFFKQFPCEGLYFTSNEAVQPVSNPSYIVEGAFYPRQFFSCSKDVIIPETYSVLDYLSATNSSLLDMPTFKQPYTPADSSACVENIPKLEQLEFSDKLNRIASGEIIYAKAA